ncbi:hypothetical protein DAPPUDRAFT_114086 [Daphnia pulex]|uniref:DDE-1 domain-containing protein n=1 Tax=Daphnia pulex TaxID=6669 RepID=E9HGZ9_DAPPU|nr:hypothetical protein DAPPUDRAFT_114086 [Daphnia pulex]|eukprot:EFX68993.1 hypothetical protein DAPPUDRAFT_114086 [Daphnia pulex]
MQFSGGANDCNNKCKPLSLSRAHIQARASHEAKLRGIQNFKASDGWFCNWRKRCLIGPSLRLFGEAGDVNIEEMEPLIQAIREKLQRFNALNIFNMDETGLFFRALPTRTYVCREEGQRKTVRGTKALRAKDRLTLVLCVNATGTCKIDPLLVGSAKKPHCFRDQESPVPYVNQKKTLGLIAKFIEAGHDPSCVDPTGQVEIIFSPPNCTSVFQPLDQGIITTLKTLYKREMLSSFVASYEKFEELQELAKKAKQGRKGLQFGHSVHVLDAGRIIKKCWDSLDEKTISACFIHARCLPHLPTEISVDGREYRTQAERRVVRDICTMFSEFSLDQNNLEKLESLGLSELTEVIHKEGVSNGEEMVRRWLHLESDPEVLAAQEEEIFNEVNETFDLSTLTE